MSLKIVKDDYREEDFQPVYHPVPVEEPKSEFRLVIDGLVKWLLDDWKYALALLIILVFAWVFGPGGR